jgi:hypothetical protein
MIRRLVFLGTCLALGLILSAGPALAGPRVVSVSDLGFSDAQVRIGQGRTVQWNVDPSDSESHTIQDLSGMEILGTGSPVPPGGSYSFAFVAAGKYPVGDSPSGDIMSVNVGLTATQVSGDTYSIQWATNIVPSCFFRVRFRPPGGEWQQLIRHTQVGSTEWSPSNGSGTYAFESRLIRGGFGKSGWSNPLEISV